MSVEVGSKLAAVVAAIDKAFCDAASQSQWIASDDGQIRTDDDPVHRCYIGAIVEPDDAAMIVAAVNFLREHHAELSALQAKLDAVTKDAERYRFLQCSPSWRIQVIRQNGAGTWEWVNPRFGYDMDEDIDEARKALTDQGRAGEGRSDG